MRKKKNEIVIDEQLKKAIEAKLKGEKNIIKLHYHPEAIKNAVKELKNEAEGELKDLFEDMEILLEWALKRLPIVPPKKEDEQDAHPQSE